MTDNEVRERLDVLRDRCLSCRNNKGGLSCSVAPYHGAWGAKCGGYTLYACNVHYAAFRAHDHCQPELFWDAAKMPPCGSYERGEA